ncbi:hypothetical protein [Acidithiobacillus caldus]|uniref:Lipoprotein n=1 Tax=Acidithiobacillus caldus TaxID=33059 RepID=A0A1E7YMM3_9PROT|nr:hypothetical protein [Acidithiobacillus caldus]OFC35206.1 hypothetical protein BAE27_07980 [Acidithiobacillus caldus]OFC36338.1 hypothetical protein BAE28_09040 [Acidithiobacillus caldus]OFC40534.1 hypothetical protein BAE29_05135 [Acidithiobacillus caldus]
MNIRSSIVLLVLPALAACAQILPSAEPAASSSRAQLLTELGHCGAADGVDCARIHFALARGYLQQAPLTSTSVDNAARELQMAAQNPKVAEEIQPWQNLIAYSRSLQRRRLSCLPTELPKAAHPATAPAKSAAEASAAQRLQRLEQLLHQQAEESLTTKAPQ